MKRPYRNLSPVLRFGLEGRIKSAGIVSSAGNACWATADLEKNKPQTHNKSLLENFNL